MIRWFLLSLYYLFCHGLALLGQNSTDPGHSFEDKSFFDDVLEHPGEYSYILIIFLVLGYFLWRVQGLGRDD